MDQKNRIVCSKTVQEGLKIVVDFARFYGCRGAQIYILESTVTMVPPQNTKHGGEVNFTPCLAYFVYQLRMTDKCSGLETLLLY